MHSQFWTQLKNRAREWNNCALLSGALQYLKCREKTYLIYLVLVLVNRTEQIDILSVMRQRNGKHCVLRGQGTNQQNPEDVLESSEDTIQGFIFVTSDKIRIRIRIR